MKKKRTIIIICSAVIAVLSAAVLWATLVPGKSNEPEQASSLADSSIAEPVTESIADESVTVPEISVDESSEDIPVVEVSDNGIDPNDTSALTPIAEDTSKDEPKPETSKEPSEPAVSVATPVEESTPKDDDNGNSGGITIGGGDNGNTEKYNCGTKGHHCDSPEVHAFVLNLELEGCPYCGKHDCPSFYAVDQWGGARYTPSECPEYDIHKDPVYYCQDCGKPVGSGSKDKCVQYVTACYCPTCGEWVEAWTCHSCGE